MRTHSVLLSLLSLTLSVGLTSACSAEGSTGAVSDSSGDSGGDSGGGGDVSADTGPTERELIIVTGGRSCYGCQSVSVCGHPPVSDLTAINIDVALYNESAQLFASARVEEAGRALPLDTCKVFTGTERDAVIDGPEGVQTLAAGDVTLSGEMALLDPPLVVETHAGTGMTELAWGRPYTAGSALEVTGQGGADVGPIHETGVAAALFEIVTPSVDGEGHIANIATDAPLSVTWTGGDDFSDAVLILKGSYCEDGPDTFVACHVVNDGSFTVGVDILDPITWPNVVQLQISSSRSQPLSASGLVDGGVLTVRSSGDLYIWWDEAAEPPPAQCGSGDMNEGYVGATCWGDHDCGGGCCLDPGTDVFKYGYCTLLGCESDADCPADAACMEQPNPLEAIPNFCAKRCASENECRGMPEYHCAAFAGGGPRVCLPGIWGE